MKMNDCGAALTSNDILRLQKTASFPIPEDYIDFLMAFNGGVPENDQSFSYFDSVTERENGSFIRSFFKIYPEHAPGEYDDLLEICDIMRNEETIPQAWLPIADDPGGNPICLCLAENHFGSVWILDHEYEDLDTGYLVASLVAPSFSAFLKMIFSD